MSPEEPRFPLRQGGIVLIIAKDSVLVGPIPDDGETGTMMLETEGPSSKSPRASRPINVNNFDATGLIDFLSNPDTTIYENIDDPEATKPMSAIIQQLIEDDLPHVPPQEQDAPPAVIQGRHQRPVQYKVVGYLYDGKTTLTPLTHPRASIKLIGYSERGKEIRSAQHVKKRRFIHPTDYPLYQPDRNEDQTQEQILTDNKASVQVSWSQDGVPRPKRKGKEETDTSDRSHVIARTEDEIEF